MRRLSVLRLKKKSRSWVSDACDSIFIPYDADRAEVGTRRKDAGVTWWGVPYGVIAAVEVKTTD